MTITDDGPGIPPAERERIFEPFHRIHSGLNEGVSGTGIGLTIARELAERHGGGLRLPADRQGGVLRSAAAPPERRREDGVMKVLIAEDDAHIRRGLVEILENEGYEVVSVRDGEAALTAFDKERPDFLCLDIMMPKINGYDVCKRIRTEAPDVPIIFISAKSEEIDRVVGLELGADDFIMKPFGVREVVARIRAVTRRCYRPAGPNRRARSRWARSRWSPPNCAPGATARSSS